MKFYTENQKNIYDIEKTLRPESEFDQKENDEKICQHWIMRYYRSGLLSVWLFKRYITKTGKLTRIIKIKVS